MTNEQRVIGGVLGAILLFTVVQAVVPYQYEPAEREPVEETACVGDPIRVDYAYNGNYLEPWACEPQCDDDVQRYVLYSNGKATQCDVPPNCNDRGEDDGVTCIPPVASE